MSFDRCIVLLLLLLLWQHLLLLRCLEGEQLDSLAGDSKYVSRERAMYLRTTNCKQTQNVVGLFMALKYGCFYIDEFPFCGALTGTYSTCSHRATIIYTFPFLCLYIVSALL